MARSCQVCGKGFSVGNQVTIRGKAKYLGGVGTKITSCTRRTFKPNLQTVNALIDGAPKRIKVSTKAIRLGLVVKPPKRKFLRQHAEQA